MTVPDNMKDPALQRTMMGAGMRKIDTLYIHYSASGDLGNAQQTRATIDAWHKARGFKMIGYHAGCTPRGERFIGRPDEMVGAHVMYHNANSLGYCNVGSDLPVTPWFPTPEQYADCAAWCREKMAKYSIPITNVKGHRDDNPTSCPGPFDVHGKLRTMIMAQPQPEEDEMGLATRAEKISKGGTARCRTWIDKGANKTLWINVSNLEGEDTTIRYFGWRNNGDFIKVLDVDLLPSQAKPVNGKMDGDDRDAVLFFGPMSSGITMTVECIKGGPVLCEWTKTI